MTVTMHIDPPQSMSFPKCAVLSCRHLNRVVCTFSQTLHSLDRNRHRCDPPTGTYLRPLSSVLKFCVLLQLRNQRLITGTGHWAQNVGHTVDHLQQSMSAGLKAFILRNEVITLYRNFCKAVKQAPDHTKGALTNT